jgi:hypothetical protein
MIKLTGPEELSSLSLGKLCSFVQKALNLNILIYYKTLLIRNNQFDTLSQNTSSEAKNAKKISNLKDQILLLLRENKGGLSLAQIPLLLKNKYKKSYNIQSLGFPKLKNLLATMEEVDLEKTQGNLLKAVLKTHNRKNSEKPLEETPKTNLGGKKFLTLRNNPLEHRLNYMHYNSNLNGNFFESQEPTHHSKGYRTVSTLEDYILKIQSTILEILKHNPFGIEVEKLKSELDRWLGVEFNYRISGAQSFQEFLINCLGDYLDIEIKKSLRTAKATGPLIHIVYPKNHKLPQQQKPFFSPEEEDINKQYDEFSNVSPSSLRQYMQSPDASFVNCFKPLLSQKEQGLDADNFKTSQSFNVGRGGHQPESLSQQGGSVQGDVALSAKSTTSQNQYSHFGKLKVHKPAKPHCADFKHGVLTPKSKEGKAKTRADRPEWPLLTDDDKLEGPISFEMDHRRLTHADTLAGKQGEYHLTSKSTQHNEDLSDAQSQKFLDLLLKDEE